MIEKEREAGRWGKDEKRKEARDSEHIVNERGGKEEGTVWGGIAPRLFCRQSIVDVEGTQKSRVT